MDAYDEGPDARRERPGGSDDPALPLPVGVSRDVPGDPAPQEAAGPRDKGGPGPDPAALPAVATSPEPGGAGRPAPEVTASPQSPSAPRTGIAALSPRYQIPAALALAVVALTACVHLGMVFLHVAPSNTLTKAHGKTIDDWIYPEFEQNWKLFAPNPLQQNINVQVRAEVLTGDGGVRTTGWYDLSALDGAAIHGNPLPSHTRQNELRRAWDFYVASHDGENRPAGLRGALSADYLRRVAVLRLGREHAAGRGETIDRVQVRTRISNVRPPKWSAERVSTTPVYRQLPWWSLSKSEQAGVGA
ncbi:DUF5819 family protein [Streptomyces yaanensis]|uniref:DUF5819 family protein n=1 Tax=Streptomyces yaanensis TaxID=1142239 RepID=A0ABV7SCY1_9ACTN|nr:DUF5819 family protein [Streptomyces sp. CGMCC 4.7035]WNB96616.1 DUF5819 family protein [Streptomyces sp. CGMCC 4.7035]